MYRLGALGIGGIVLGSWEEYGGRLEVWFGVGGMGMMIMITRDFVWLRNWRTVEYGRCLRTCDGFI